MTTVAVHVRRQELPGDTRACVKRGGIGNGWDCATGCTIARHRPGYVSKPKLPCGHDPVHRTIDIRGYRYCAECHRAAERARYHRQKGAA